jgi:hypothetical protein
MFVNCFVVNMKEITCSIEELCEQFGSNIPKYLEYEGGSGWPYLFCVDDDVDYVKICKANGYDIHPTCTTKLQIDKSTYNNKYQIHPTYNKSEYVLTTTIF